MWATTIMAPPPLAEVAARLVAGPDLEAIQDERRRDAERRQGFAREELGEWIADGVSPYAQFVWLEVDAADVATIVARAHAAGVRDASGNQFSPDPRARIAGIRNSLVHETDDEVVVDGLRRLRAVLRARRQGRVLGV
jgi:hypothetical protein